MIEERRSTDQLSQELDALRAEVKAHETMLTETHAGMKEILGKVDIMCRKVDSIQSIVVFWNDAQGFFATVKMVG